MTSLLQGFEKGFGKAAASWPQHVKYWFLWTPKKMQKRFICRYFCGIVLFYPFDSFWGFLNLVSTRFSFLKAIHLFSAIAKTRLTCVSSSPAPEIPPAGSSSRALQFPRPLPWHQIMSLASTDHPLNLSHKKWGPKIHVEATFWIVPDRSIEQTADKQ